MLVIRCSACRKKLWKYLKIGPGEVLRCHKARISKNFGMTRQGEDLKPNQSPDKIYCRCGKEIGIDKGSYYKMIAKAFTYSGKKIP